MKKEWLSCVYDTRKSFYGKALITRENNAIILTSYKSKVAMIQDNMIYINHKIPSKKLYSHTTLRHIKEFIKQYLFKENVKITKKQLENTRGF